MLGISTHSFFLFFFVPIRCSNEIINNYFDRMLSNQIHTWHLHLRKMFVRSFQCNMRLVAAATAAAAVRIEKCILELFRFNVHSFSFRCSSAGQSGESWNVVLCSVWMVENNDAVPYSMHWHVFCCWCPPLSQEKMLHSLRLLSFPILLFLFICVPIHNDSGGGGGGSWSVIYIKIMGIEIFAQHFHSPWVYVSL